MTAKTVSVTKLRTEKLRRDRDAALQLFLSLAHKLGLKEAWLVGSMATDNDHPLSDVDLCVKGSCSIEKLYSLRDKIYLRTGVIIQLITEPPRNPKVKIYGP